MRSRTTNKQSIYIQCVRTRKTRANYVKTAVGGDTMASNSSAGDVGGGGGGAVAEGGGEAAPIGTPSPSSPRNSSYAGSSSSGGGGAMAASAGASNSLYVQMGCIEVPKALQDGEKFIKWDEVSVGASSRLGKRHKGSGLGSGAGGIIQVYNDAPNMVM